jgi:hypothetical protein
VSGRDYIEVKWRLVWLRDTHPDAVVDTDLLHHANQTAIFRAKVTLPGGACATGHGSESSTDFGDYLEKAETKAIGRALAALGFGTQFAGLEFEDRATAHAQRSSAPPAQGALAQPPRQDTGPRPSADMAAAVLELNAAVADYGLEAHHVDEKIEALWPGVRYQDLNAQQIQNLTMALAGDFAAARKAFDEAHAAEERAEAERNPPGSGMDANLPPAFDAPAEDPEGFDDPPETDHSSAITTPGPDNTAPPRPAKTPSNAPATQGMVDKIMALIREHNVTISAVTEILEEHAGPNERAVGGKWPNKLSDALGSMTAGQARIVNKKLKEWIAVHRT